MTEYIFDIDELILFILKKMEEISASIFFKFGKKSDKKSNEENNDKKSDEKNSKPFQMFCELLNILLYVKEQSILFKKKCPDFFIFLDELKPFYKLDFSNINLSLEMRNSFKNNENIDNDIKSFFRALNLLHSFFNKEELKNFLNNFYYIKDLYNKGLDEKVRNEKKQFYKKVFNLEKKIAYFEEHEDRGYNNRLKKSTIKEILLDLINIKKEFDDENCCLYLVNRKRKGNTRTYELYNDIQQKTEGINTSILCDQLLSRVSEKTYPLEIIDKEDLYFDKKCISLINFISTKNYNKIVKLSFQEKKNFLEEKELLTQKPFKSWFDTRYEHFEKLKNNLYFILETFSILHPEYIKELTNIIKKKEGEIKNYNLENQIRLQKSNIKVSLLSKEYIDKRNNNKELQKSLNKIKEWLKVQISKQNSQIINDKKNNNIFKENKKLLKELENINNEKNKGCAYKLKINCLKNIPDEILIPFLKSYIQFFLTKQDSKFTVKDELLRNIVVYLRINDYIAELKMHLKILEDLKDKENKYLVKELEKQETIYKENCISESLLEKSIENFVLVKSQSSVKAGIYNKCKINKKTKKEYKDQEEPYLKLYRYKNAILYIKYIKLKFYFYNNSVFSKNNYFNDFYILLNTYTSLIESILDTTNLYDKVNIDTYIFNIIYTICNQPRNIDKDEIMPLNSN